MHAPRSTRGASRGVLECGSGAVVSEGCNTHTRAETAEAARSRRASRASPGALGGMSYRRCQPPRHAEAPEAVERLPRRRGRKPERYVHRGSCGAGFKHRARDAGEMADLRSYRLRLSAARRSGPRVRQDPGVPRRPRFSAAQLSQNSGAKTRRENESGCLKIGDKANERAANAVVFPSPLRGGVRGGGRESEHGLATPTPPAFAALGGRPSPTKGRLRPSSTGYGGG